MSKSEFELTKRKARLRGDRRSSSSMALFATSPQVDLTMETTKTPIANRSRFKYSRANAIWPNISPSVLTMAILLLMLSHQLATNSAAQLSTQDALKKEVIGVELTTSSPASTKSTSVDLGETTTGMTLASSAALGLEERRQMTDGSQLIPVAHNNTDPDSDLRATTTRAAASATAQLQDDMTTNATLLIDYDQQGYYLSTSSDFGGTTPSATTTGEKSTSCSTGGQAEAASAQKSTQTTSLPTTTSQAISFTKSQEGEKEELRDVDFEPAVKSIDDASRARSLAMRDSRDARLAPDKPLPAFNATDIYKVLFKKKPYSKFWTVEQKWDDIFKRFLAVEGSLRRLMLRSFLRDVEYYADIGLSEPCTRDFKYAQEYARRSTNFRWLAHMLDSTGKSEPGMLTGNLANLGHVIQCVRVRAPAQFSNHTFSERYFEQQTQLLGERFRGKYCLASVRPVLPEKPHLVSRFSEILNVSMLSNISYMGEPIEVLRRRVSDVSVARSTYRLIDRQHPRLDQVPFESEMYQYLIEQRNFIYSLPRFLGVCYPSSCTRDDIQASIQKTLDEQHLVADIEFECEQEDLESSWDWYSTPRLVALVFAILVASIIVSASVARYILVSKLNLHKTQSAGKLANLIGALDLLSMDKCAGILFVKTRRASPIVDASKVENNRSSSIDALKGLLMLATIYSELVYLGCLPVPFMWSKWADAMFPFYRAFVTQFFLNVTIWSEAFYTISAFVIALKFLQNHRHQQRHPDLASFVLTRYVRLTSPVLAFMTLNYIWPRLSNGFVMQDQASKILGPCDQYGWTNVLLFHNHGKLNDTCLWPSHVSATFFQLHLLSYPILVLLLMSLTGSAQRATAGVNSLVRVVISHSGMICVLVLALFGIVYPAIVAADQQLIVPFLIDYIDVDNYRRVIEWTVLPTYNHLTAYMMGIAVAYLVVKRTQKRSSSTGGDSPDSFKTYSSTNALELDCPTPTENNSKPANPKVSSSHISSIAINLASLITLLLSTTTSWYWNGLGQPMTPRQTFWYLCATKLGFSISFAVLFYRHFSTRRNSTSPWMITRFLVPIGRLGLTLFYMSWLVIWFDLLASLYQWHPSHYFVCEKFNEIIFISLVISMFVYGAFEGTIKLARLKQKSAKLSLLPSPPNVDLQQQQEQRQQQSRQSVNCSTAKPFDTFYLPIEPVGDPSGPGDEAERALRLNDMSSGQPRTLASTNYQRSSVSCDPNSQGNRQPGKLKDNLSISDQYKLNAELRANYSFASIGLYESAGATSDLQPHANDPQVSG